MDFAKLKHLVAQGEGIHLEFKRKANHPDKIARELVAFANTKGGRLLVGVEDDGQIFGSKTPDGDAFEIARYLERHCTPALSFKVDKVPVSARREVLIIHIVNSKKKPHFLLSPEENGGKAAYVRADDMSITASREMVAVLRHVNRKQGVKLIVGEPEQTLLQHFDETPRLTLDQACNLLKSSRRRVSHKLVLLVRAGLLRIHPTTRGDYYTLAEEAFLHSPE